MRTERLIDNLDRPWTLGESLGRGTWGRSFLVTGPQGQPAVLKVPLTAADFSTDAPDPAADLPAAIAESCRSCADEQSRLLDLADLPFVPPLDGLVALEGGRTGLILPRYPETLQHRLDAGFSIEEALDVVARICDRLAQADRPHGNLRPTNVLFDPQGQIWLSDPATPGSRGHLDAMRRPIDAAGWFPPEGGPLSAGRDTWSLAQLIHATALSTRGAEPHGPPRLAAPGLDKVALANLKDRVMDRLTRQATNPRFRSRVADRLGALLSRALSAQTEPSPPYRFAACRPFGERVSEVGSLVHPHVVDVGKIMLPDTTFRGGETVRFSVTVACTPGLTDHEDLVCGLQVIDLDAPGDGRVPVEEAQFAVQVHPSGRLRYKLGLPSLPPGRYRIHAAFAVKESGDEPHVARIELEVRPPPGYVPPRLDEPPEPLTFPGAPRKARSVPTGPRPLTPNLGHVVPLTPLDPPPPRAEPAGAPTAPVWRTAPDPALPAAPDGFLPPAFPTPIAPPEEDRPLGSDPTFPPRALRPGEIRPVSLIPPGDPVDPPDPRHADHRIRPRSGLRPLDPVLDTEELLDDTESAEIPHHGLGDPDPPPLLELSRNTGEDLPSWERQRPSPLPRTIARFTDALRRDTYLAVGTAITASLVLVVTLSLLIRAC